MSGVCDAAPVYELSRYPAHFETKVLDDKNNEDSVKKLTSDDLVHAATLVQDAKHGRNMNFKPGTKYIKAYLLYEHPVTKNLLYFFILLLLLLALVEDPSVLQWTCPYYVIMILETICLIFFSFRTWHGHYFDSNDKFWIDPKNFIVTATIMITAIDMIGYLVWAYLDSFETAVRWSRPLRPLFIINFPDGRQIRKAFRNIRRTMNDIMTILALFLVTVLLFTILSVKIFEKRTNITYSDGSDYFKNFLDSFWDLYVLVTTANYPDVMMPAYDYNNWFALFFIVYLVVCLYIFMTIVLAVIFYNYKKNLKDEVRFSVYTKRRKLREAFEILKEWRGGKYVITEACWHSLMNIIDSKRSKTQVNLLLSVLDSDGNNNIDRKSFLNVADLLRIRVTEISDRITVLEKAFPGFYNSYCSKGIQKVVRNRLFRYFFDFLILLNAFTISFSVDDADWFFLAAFTLEILLKLYTYGPLLFIRQFWNVFDVIVIGGALIYSIIIEVKQDSVAELDFLLILRVVRLAKLLGTIKRFKVIIQTVVNIGPFILTYGGVMFVFYYMFAIVGMEIFKGKIQYLNPSNFSLQSKFCGNVKLIGSQFATNRYCGNNFNNILRAMVTLFELTVVNQWHVIASGFVIVTNKAARLYFFIFHLISVVIILNIFIAIVLEAFLLEYSLSKAGILESAIECKIKEMGLGVKIQQSREQSKQTLVDDELDVDLDTDIDVLPEEGIRFHLKKRSRKKAEVLLQEMFEGELDHEDEDDSDIDISLPSHVAVRKKHSTFDTIT